MSVRLPALPLTLDPLIAEAKRRMRRRRLLFSIGAAVAIVATAVVISSEPSQRTTSVAALAGPFYTVSTTVTYSPSEGHPLACEASLLMTNEPGGGCTGVALAGFDFSRFEMRQYPGGGWETSFLRIVGRWNGDALEVSSAVPATHGAGPAEPNCRAHETGPRVRVSNRALTALEGHVQLFESGPCGHTYSFLVPVADRRTVNYLQRRFGRSILVESWLQRVGRATRGR